MPSHVPFRVLLCMQIRLELTKYKEHIRSIFNYYGSLTAKMSEWGHTQTHTYTHKCAPELGLIHHAAAMYSGQWADQS